MRYIADFIKVLVLVALIMASIYQTGELWFEGSSDRNFFYDVLNKGNAETRIVNTEGTYIEAAQIGLFIGSQDVDYTVIGSGSAAYRSVEDALIKSIATILKSGTPRETLKISDLDLHEHFLLTTPFLYTGSELKDGLGITGSDIDVIDSARAFRMVPAGPESRSVDLYVESGSSDNVYRFQINQEVLTIENEVLLYQMTNIMASEAKTAYISTSDLGLSIFDRTILLPLTSKEIRYHSSVFWKIPYVTEGLIDNEAVKAVADPFYNNPGAVGQVAFENEVNFLYRDIGLTYDTNGILTYERDSETTRTATSLYDALYIAEDFAKGKLSLIVPEYYLADYQMYDASVTLYYNVGYNDYPIVMDSASQDMTGMKYPIEITVKNGVVTEAKMLLREVEEQLPQLDVFDMPYGDALDLLFVKENINTLLIDKMYLGYKWNSGQEAMRLHWIIESGEEKYFVEVGGL